MLALRAFSIFLLAYWIQQVLTEDERPFLRILAPAFICNDKKSNQTTQNNNLTIGLQTREGQKLRYAIKVYFEMLNGFKSQQHTLSIWKNIRMLQKKFWKSSTEISLKNQIEINAKELTPQVVYTFHVVGYDEMNRSSEVQNFSITYQGGELKTQQSNIGDGVSLLLLGSEFIYDDMEFLAVAEVSFCDAINNFSYRWKIEGAELSGIESFNGNSLRLPPESFMTGSSLVVTVMVVNSEIMEMARTTLPMKILSKDFQVQIIPVESSVGVSREIPMQALLSRQPASAVGSVKWSCTKNNEDCSEIFNSSDSSQSQLVTFQSDGAYQVQVEVTINESAKTSAGKIEVNSKVIPHVQIKYFPPQPINVMQSNEIIVTVLNLIPKCFAFWNIVTNDEFAAFNEIEGNFTNMGYVFIKDFEEYFLQELVDYDNNTVSRDVVLAIPAEALKPQKKYKFSLTITCPPVITEGTTETNTTVKVASFFDIIFGTNGPPETLPLVVKPSNGSPMKTKFKFSTGSAKDLNSDFPLKYKFGYIVDNLTVTIGTFYETTVATSQLPFAEEIETFCDVCDNNGACIRISGTSVAAIDTTSLTSEQIEFKLSEFDASVKRSEYSNSFNTAVVFLLTLRKLNEETSSYETKMFSMMKQELATLKASDRSDLIHQQQVIEFVKMSKNLIGIMTVSDETFVDDLLTLTEIINRASRRTTRMILSQEFQAKVVNHDVDYIKNVLSLSEILLASNNATIAQREKPKFIEKVHRFVRSICQNRNVNTQMIESKFTTFETSKLFFPQISLEPLTMPGSEDSATILFSNGNYPAKYVCVAKIKFMVDMFQQDTTSVYETLIIDETSGETYPVADLSETAVIEMSSSDLSKTCLILKNETWSADACSKQKSNSTNQLSCKCKLSGTEGITFKVGNAVVEPTEPSALSTLVLGGKLSTTTAFTFLSTRTTLKYEASATTIEVPKGTEAGSTTKEALKVTEVPRTTEASKVTEPARTTEVLSLTEGIQMTEISNEVEPLKEAKTSKGFEFTTNEPPTSTPAIVSSHITSEFEKIISSTASTKAGGASKTTLKGVDSTVTTKSPVTAGKDASVSWTLIILLLVFLLLIIVLFSLHRCRRCAQARMNLPMRSPANGIKYAKYHDEFTMRG